MTITILPSKANGKMEAPPSKSMAHRLLICAGLAEGTSVIQNIDFSEDILATIDCLMAMGAEISCGDRSVTVRNPLRAREAIGEIVPAEPEGTLPEVPCCVPEACSAYAPAALDCRECGSTLRFMIPLCLMSGQMYMLRGSRTLFTRPLTVYEDICRKQGLTFIKEGDQLTVSGRLKAGEYEIPGNISSQFVSGLLFALPLLDGDSRIRLIPPVESRSYIGMTLQAQEQFGVRAEWEDDLTIRIRGGQKYRPQKTRVEGDYSNAAFFEALNLAGGNVTVEGLKADSLQGDRVYRQHLDKIREGYAEIDLSDCPDLGPVLIAAAALQHGAKFIGTRRLKIKESDRGLAMRQELDKMGVTVETEENEIFAHAGAERREESAGAECREEPADEECFGKASSLRRPKEPLDGHNDHRIVMALAVMLTKTGGTIRGAEAVRKSLPDFWDRLAELGVEMRVEQE